jgi:hypothetical protein
MRAWVGGAKKKTFQNANEGPVGSQVKGAMTKFLAYVIKV